MSWTELRRQKLIQAVLSLKNDAEARSFLRDLMTEKEIDEFAKRLQAAEMLTQKSSYVDIEKKTGLSSATIARVAKWLNGKEGGYKTIIDRLHHKDDTKIA